MSDFTESLVAMKDATEELVQAKDVFETIFDDYQETLAGSIQAIQNLKSYPLASGKNTLSVNSPVIVTDLVAGDEFGLIVGETNDSANVSINVNGQGAKAIANVTWANQLFAGALVTLRYDGTDFYVTEQINPKTGNAVSDIGKLVTDTTNVLSIGEVALNGAELSRDEYAIAWAKIKSTSNLIDQATKDADPITYGGYWGLGDGLTTFTLPIVGGEFIRMFDGGRGVDSGRGFASYQGDAFQGHWHATAEGGDNSSGAGYIVNGPSYSSMENSARDAISDGQNGEPRVADETRPRSIAFYGKTRL